MPPLGNVKCREILNRVQAVRIYPRLPRKLKKRLKKTGGTMSVNFLEIIDKCNLNTSELLGNYAAVKFKISGNYTFEPFNHERFRR